jgi:hypothetical protein
MGRKTGEKSPIWSHARTSSSIHLQQKTKCRWAALYTL